MGSGAERSQSHLISYQIEFKDSAAKSPAKLPKKIQRRIQGVITTLATNPLPPAASKLTGRDAYRIRVSDYRIIYSVHQNILTIVVVAVCHRREIYRKD
jgi:mRNA interferase RelE/StbE